MREGNSSGPTIACLLQFAPCHKKRLGVLIGCGEDMSTGCYWAWQTCFGVIAKGSARLGGGDGAVEELCVDEYGAQPCRRWTGTGGSGA